MTRFALRFVFVALLVAPLLAADAADDFKLEEGFSSLFDGKTLTGWQYGPLLSTWIRESLGVCKLQTSCLQGFAICQLKTPLIYYYFFLLCNMPNSFRMLGLRRMLTAVQYGPVPVSKKPIIEKLDSKTATKDKVFEVSEGLIVASGKRVMALYTAKEYNKDFQFKLEFRTTAEKPKNNSGIYIRGPQLQLDAVTQGGLTGVFKKLKQFKPGDWNEIEITVKGTEAVCKCNGELIGKPMKIPATGTIGLQSEHGRFEFRRIRIKEMP